LLKRALRVLVDLWWRLRIGKADCRSAAVERCWCGSIDDNSVERDGMWTQSWSTAAQADIIADGKYIRSFSSRWKRSVLFLPVMMVMMLIMGIIRLLT